MLILAFEANSALSWKWIISKQKNGTFWCILFDLFFIEAEKPKMLKTNGDKGALKFFT